ncbi:MAG: hypothetical protein ACE37F_18660 [Nannocystaceae bacterium]|nr:hypothetical protein [bacterium]
MVCWARFRLGGLALSLLLCTACDDTGAGPDSGSSEGSGDTSAQTDGATSGADASTGSATTGASATATTSGPASTGASTDPTADPTNATDAPDPSGSDSSGEGPVPREGWIEIGYGLDEFFPFEGELPVTLGPQGFMMFSLPLRGSNFPVAPDPFDFDHPDTPILSVWTDIEGIEGEHPSGHFAAYLNYPVPFMLSDDEDVDYEFVSVWLVIPETYSPAELAGREAVVHAELDCADGQFLIDEHVLTVVDDTVGSGGEG